MPLLLIAVAALAAIVLAVAFSRRTGIATPLLLVAVGIAGSYLPGVPTVEIEPEWILAGVLPPLLYASSSRLPVIDFRRNLAMITWLSVVLVVASAVVIGLTVHWLFPQIPLALGIALGAVVSPTDAVAATAIGKRVGLPHRVMTVLEGESLVNDASALVTLRTAIAATSGAFSFGSAVGEFAVAVAVATAVGAVGGAATVWVRSRIDDPVLNSAISFVVPFLVFFPAEELHASGVLAVVVAGLVTSAAGFRHLSARDRQTEGTIWTTISFLLESGLFLLMGLQLPPLIASHDGDSGTHVIGITAVVVGLAILLRTLGVAAPHLIDTQARTQRMRDRIQLIEADLDTRSATTDREQNRIAWARRRLARSAADADFEDAQPITRRARVVIAWSGMRGAITVAAAQTIPSDLPHRSTVVLVAYLVAVITLIGFGGTLPWVIRRLDIKDVSIEDQRQEVSCLMTSLFETVTTRLGPLADQEVDGKPVDPAITDAILARLAPIVMMKKKGVTAPNPQARDISLILQRRYLEALADALHEERSIGAYRTETFAQIQGMLDAMESRLETA